MCLVLDIEDIKPSHEMELSASAGIHNTLMNIKEHWLIIQMEVRIQITAETQIKVNLYGAMV